MANMLSFIIGSGSSVKEYEVRADKRSAFQCANLQKIRIGNILVFFANQDAKSLLAVLTECSNQLSHFTRNESFYHELYTVLEKKYGFVMPCVLLLDAYLMADKLLDHMDLVERHLYKTPRSTIEWIDEEIKKADTFSADDKWMDAFSDGIEWIDEVNKKADDKCEDTFDDGYSASFFDEQSYDNNDVNSKYDDLLTDAIGGDWKEEERQGQQIKYPSSNDSKNILFNFLARFIIKRLCTTAKELVEILLMKDGTASSTEEKSTKIMSDKKSNEILAGLEKLYTPLQTSYLEDSTGLSFDQLIFSNAISILFFDFRECQKDLSAINVCQTCGRFFVYNYRDNEMYCQICRTYGSRKKAKTIPAWNHYKKAVKHYENQRAYRAEIDNNSFDTGFKAWKKEARIKRDSVISGTYSLEDYDAWLADDAWFRNIFKDTCIDVSKIKPYKMKDNHK